MNYESMHGFCRAGAFLSDSYFFKVHFFTQGIF